MNEKITTFSFKYIGFCLYIFGVPGLLYLFAKLDPFIDLDEYGDPMRLGIYPIAIVYWILIFFVYKYKTNQDRYKYALERILKLDRSLSADEKFEIYTDVLLIPKWEFDEKKII
jgi:hypothetical protein